MNAVTLASPLTLPCGAVIKNRFGKAPLTEGLADPEHRATERHVRLYRRWAEGGAGLVVTGNVQVDRRYLERPGNVVIDGPQDAQALARLRAYAEAGTANGTQLWMQLNHPGRQTPRRVCEQPVAPSAVKLNLPESAFAPPRALTADEVDDVIARFAHAAKVAQDTGFSGVQVHAAHGYLLSQFLTPLVNRRTDRWGGSLENRARLLLEIVRAIRAACGPAFPIGAKLNSSDFQQGGFDNDECLQVVQWLEQAGLDHLEISGGNYEEPSMMGSKTSEGKSVAESTVKREAYFMEYAEQIRAVTKLPLMVTGGFRSRASMEQALASGALDMIGLGRPMCVETDAPDRLLAGAESVGAWEREIRPPKAGMGWFALNLIRHGDGLDPDTAMTGEEAIRAYVANEEATAQRMARPAA
ncbi:NADH:flavin oxidoreductase/NADH oxidase family protein [Minwuia thermotolerans]|uniref:NADH:flavin oxidoreductase n=1 Tax=Minwuia thermotolerans TaxID=2056226 RepID=A0A2M9G6M9_9PROT|nr:NADH:flavin oxidoreductase/NADH oxidase family protein [Minwuia thermotolerans]PJK31326.1 NADH:flavin oxidoreductase [Minwuia thermotolerans]